MGKFQIYNLKDSVSVNRRPADIQPTDHCNDTLTSQQAPDSSQVGFDYNAVLIKSRQAKMLTMEPEPRAREHAY